MACNPIVGITYSCDNNTAGVKAIYIANVDDVISFTASTGEITNITMNGGATFQIFQFNKNNASITEATTVSVENGSTFVTQTVTLNIPKREVTKRNKIQALVAGIPRLYIIVLDANNEYWLVGYSEGAYVTAMDSQSGLNKTEGNFYNITLTAEEPEYAYGIDQAAVLAVI